ncbi:MAG: hypothetical protein ACREUH_05840 [Burkholderiales bacterium]
MKDIETLEAQFDAELRRALARALRGASPTLFSLNENGSRSSARSLRTKAERILELRRTYTEISSEQPFAARYLTACLKWQHQYKSERQAVAEVARDLLREMREHAA